MSTTMEFKSMSRPALEIHSGDQIGEQEHEEESRNGIVLQKGDEDELEISSFKIITRSNCVGESKDEDHDGFRTPTSVDQRTSPLILKCPPAPRKPKSLPLKKRKFAARRRILLDLSDEVESLYPPALLADLGNKIKKAKTMNVT